MSNDMKMIMENFRKIKASAKKLKMDQLNETLRLHEMPMDVPVDDSGPGTHASHRTASDYVTDALIKAEKASGHEGEEFGMSTQLANDMLRDVVDNGHDLRKKLEDILGGGIPIEITDEELLDALEVAASGN